MTDWENYNKTDIDNLKEQQISFTSFQIARNNYEEADYTLQFLRANNRMIQATFPKTLITLEYAIALETFAKAKEILFKCMCEELKIPYLTVVK